MKEQNLTPEYVNDLRSVTAAGVSGNVAGRNLLIGNLDFLRNEEQEVKPR